MIRKDVMEELNARYDVSFANFDNAIISSGGASHTRLICKDSSGQPARLTDEDVAMIAVRYIHNGNMHHPPSDDTEILFRM